MEGNCLKELDIRRSCYVIITIFICSIVLYKSLPAYNDKHCSRNLKCANALRTEKLRSEECQLPCTSKDCLHYADTLLESLNSEADPCEDFYAFACGGYIGKFGKSDSHSFYEDLTAKLERSLKGLLDGLAPASGSVFEKLKMLYDSCMDIQSSELNAAPAALSFLKDMGIPEWPVLDHTFQFDEIGLSEVLGRLMAYDEYAFLRFQASPYHVKDPNNKTSIAFILPQNPLQDEKTKNITLGETVRRILSYFVSEEESYEVWEEFLAIENVITQWRNRNGSVPGRCENLRYRNINCAEEHQSSLKFLCNVWNTAVGDGDMTPCFAEDKFHISCSEGSYVDNVLSSLSQLSHRSIANYLGIRFFIAHLGDMNTYFLLAKHHYIRAKDKSLQDADQVVKWEHCVGRVSQMMHEAIGYLYASTCMGDAVNDITSMIQTYRREVQTIVENQHWISQNLKHYLTKQLGELSIGFSKTMELYSNETYVQNVLRKYNVTRKSYLRNVLEYKRSSLCDLERDPNVQTAFLADSYWYTMDFGLGLFQPPAYSHRFSKLWNYASLGSILGHEVGHNFKNIFDYFSMDDTIEKFGNRTDCFGMKYSQFEIKSIGKKLKINQVQEEIIADNIGWMISEKIIKELLKNFDNALRLPSVQYTPDQLAYIAFAQTSCSIVKKEDEEDLYKTTTYIPSNLRVIGVLQNSARFSEVFNCSLHNYMNPRPKCAIFD